MLTILKEKIEVEENLMKKINMICEFANVNYILENGYVRKIDKTNLFYVEPHKLIINGINFLLFNNSSDVYVETLNNKLKLSDLEEYIKSV